MRPGIGRNASCASGDWLTSRPKGSLGSCGSLIFSCRVLSSNKEMNNFADVSVLLNGMCSACLLSNFYCKLEEAMHAGTFQEMNNFEDVSVLLASVKHVQYVFTQQFFYLNRQASVASSAGGRSTYM